MIILSTTLTGVALARKARLKELICAELYGLCGRLGDSIRFTQAPIKPLLSGLISSDFRHLGFITPDMVEARCNPKSCLSDSENKAIGEFLFSLGKTNTESQLNLILAFGENIKKSKEAYAELYRKNSKIYITFGIFSGILISLIII